MPLPVTTCEPARYCPAPILSSPSSVELERYTQNFRNGRGALSEYYKLLDRFAELESKLVRAGRLSRNWNSYGAEPPDVQAVEMARLTLRWLREAFLPPRQLAASAEGGIVLCFTENQRYADIEILNTGEISMAMYERGSEVEEPVIEIGSDEESLRGAIASIREHQTQAQKTLELC
jgi:hypothetical protein